jgi:hypothetical protein
MSAFGTKAPAFPSEVAELIPSAHKIYSVDLPPLKWSSVKYYFRMEDKIDGKEEAYG